MTHSQSAFNTPHAAASYAENARRNVPGLDDLHRMAALLLVEQAPVSARILVVGAGGGMETLAMADALPEWRFTGVDPSRAMLDSARDLLNSCLDRVDLIEGTVETLSDGLFDGATCLLTFHHIPLD
jgi:tRNA (cmo5U34)-methyltransferase